MKKFISFFLIVTFVIGLFSSCGKTESTTSLKIGTSNITGNFNPFYAESEGDKQIAGQIYLPIQYRNSNNKLINLSGDISYEYIGTKQVKYIVTIKNDLYFPDGSNVTIDDVIFWYYVLADATYDGPYSDFYLNDIEGVKEYYYDDKNYEDALISLTSDNSIKSYIDKNYSDGIDVSSISGIKRIDDYTCSILFNSRNINSISQINAYIVSKAFASKEYQKGKADVLKEYTYEIPGCGAYSYSDMDDSSYNLIYNRFYEDGNQYFKELEFIDISEKNKTPYELVENGSIDVVTTTANSTDIKKISDSNVKYFITNNDEYSSLCFNLVKVDSSILRKAIMGSVDCNNLISSEYGNYYTKPISPLSIRFEEYPSEVTEEYFNKSFLTAYNIGKTGDVSLNAYCSGDEDSLDYKILTALSEKLADSGIKIKVNLCESAELINKIKNGTADMWITSFKDEATCDKYEYYNSSGKYNYTHISSSDIDSLTSKIKRSTGFDDKISLTDELMKLVMQEAAEYPLYQLQNVTIYNTDTINPECLVDIKGYDDYTYVIHQLYA